MSNCQVDSLTLPLNGRTHLSNPEVACSDLYYAEGESLGGGPCGEWLKFQVHSTQRCWPGTLRLHLESREDHYFKATVHVGGASDERDLTRGTPSCVNTRLMNNSHSQSVHNNFDWDVCVTGERTYNVRYRVLLKGMFWLHVRLDGNDIAGSPFGIFVSDGRTSAQATRVANAHNLKCRAMPLIKGMVDAMCDERWDFECKNQVSEEYQRRRLATLDNLKKYAFANELVLNLCDRTGNPVQHKQPYVNAWSTNLGRVIDVKHRGDGTVSVKYVVVVPREELEGVKRFYAGRADTVLPSFLRNLGTPCCLHVQLDGETVFGSPFVPEVTNLAELEEYYRCFPDTFDALTSELKRRLASNDFDGCMDALFSFFHQNRELDAAKKAEAAQVVSRLFAERANALKRDSFLRESEMFKMSFVRSYALGQLHQFVDSQYQIMLKSKTSSIVECIKELNSYNSSVNGETKGFKNLADVIFNYTKIGDELRKLHRYDLADKFDAISDRICEEIELSRWEKLLVDRREKMLKIKSQVDESTRKLAAFRERVLAKYDGLEFKPVPKLPIDKGVQTAPQASVTGRLLDLVRNRCSPAEGASEVDRLVAAFWRRCSNYDIHSTIARVLKSSIRLKNAINEIFFYYSRPYETSDDMLQYAIPRSSMEQFLIDADISRSLLNNARKAGEMFDKFSAVLRGERVLPENMWCVYLRELAYLNLLYKIAESGDVTLLRDHMHPSRLSAFHHFCDAHLIRLYERLFTTRPDFQRHLKFYNTKKQLITSNFKYAKESAQLHYFPSETDLANYITAEVPNLVGDSLSEELLHVLFRHYSRLSMRGRARDDPGSYRCDDDAWLSTAMFVVFARDFGIVPGYMDGAAVQKIADDTILANIEQNAYPSPTLRGRLFYKDFVDALVNIISNSLFKIALNRHEMYTKSLKDSQILNITKKNKFHETRACVQSQESVLEDVRELVAILGLNAPAHVEMTIEAIYGQEALEYLH